MQAKRRQPRFIHPLPLCDLCCSYKASEGKGPSALPFTCACTSPASYSLSKSPVSERRKNCHFLSASRLYLKERKLQGSKNASPHNLREWESLCLSSFSFSSSSSSSSLNEPDQNRNKTSNSHDNNPGATLLTFGICFSPSYA